MAQQQKWALVTGGANGIGEAIASKLSSEGIRVVVADSDIPAETYSNVHFINCDVTIKEDVENVFYKMKDDLNIPDILVLNAGLGNHELLTEGDPEKWFRLINVNVVGALRFIRAFVPAMQQKNGTSVIFIGSVAAKKCYRYGGVYAASKAALAVIAETLRIENLGKVSVSVISPGLTKTEFVKRTETYPSDVSILSPETIAHYVWQIINQPRGVEFNEIIIRPTTQEF